MVGGEDDPYSEVSPQHTISKGNKVSTHYMENEDHISVDINEPDKFTGGPTIIEGSSDQLKDNNISQLDNDNKAVNDAEEVAVLERLRSNSSMVDDSTTTEKPSLIPNESRFKPIEYLIGSLNSALDSLAFDKTLVIQSKMAGELNNTSNEVLKMIEEIETSLKEHIIKYERLKQEIIPGIESNLKKGNKIADRLTNYVKDVYPVEYSKGRSKVLDNLTEDEEGLYS